MFALLGFCYVPLGQRTGLEHAKAILTTPAALRAGGELVNALVRVRGKVLGETLPVAGGPHALPHPRGPQPKLPRFPRSAPPDGLGSE